MLPIRSSLTSTRMKIVCAALIFSSPVDLIAAPVAISVQPNAAGAVFVSPDKPSFSVQGAGAGNWTLFDWQGRQIQAGNLSAPGNIAFSSIGNGYYRLVLSPLNQTIYFAVLPKISAPQDSVFASDSAHSWLVPPARIPFVSNLERQAGLRMVRDRFNWSQTQSAPNAPYQWGQYDASATAMSKNGIQTLGVFHDAPKWSRGNFNKLPDNLIALNAFCSAASNHFKGRVADWEFWNEEDIGFNTDPAWNFAAAQKACYLGYKKGNPEVKVLLGAAAQPIKPGSLIDLAFSNGVGDYFDLFNFHIYLPTRNPGVSLMRMYESSTQAMQAHGIRKPFWVTEVGIASEGDGRLRSMIGSTEHAEHDSQQELLQAAMIVQSQMMLVALGSQRNFSFIFPPLNEKNKVWGFLRWDYSIKPAFAAMANLNYQLAGRKYQGSVNLGGSSVGYLFDDNGNQTLVISSAGGINVIPEKFLHGDSVKIIDMLGGSIRNIGDAGIYPIYITGLTGIKPDAGPVEKIASMPNNPSNLVVNLKVGPGFSVKNRIAVDGQHGEVLLDVYNFSDQAVTGSISPAETSTAIKIHGLPSSIVVNAGAKVSIPLTLDVSSGGGTLQLVSNFGGDKRVAAFVPFEGH